MRETTPGPTAGFMLLLNTCGEPGDVGVAELGEGQAAALTVRSLPGRQTQERLLPEISALLEACGIQTGAVRVIAVVNGPGSFTGVRVGLAAAMGLAEALQVPVVQLSRLLLLAAQHGDGPVAEAWLEAGRGDVFRGRYRNGRCVDETMLRAEDALAGMSAAGAVVMEEALLTLSPQLRLVPAGLAEALPLLLHKLREGESVDAAQVFANYLRVPDAELARQARLRATV